MDSTNSIAAAAAVLERLTAEQVAARLDALHAEERSLRTLLRTLRARETAARRRQPREVRR